MRTTLDIDDEVLAAARAIAADDGRSVGAVVSDLARRSLFPRRRSDGDDDIPTFEVSAGAAPLTPETVKLATGE
jgi:hypothetical protein